MQSALDPALEGPLTEPEDKWRLPRKPLPRYESGVAKYACRNQTGKQFHAKAQAIVPAKLLQQKLGKTTFRVWAALTGIRNSYCETHPTIEGIAKLTQRSEHSVERSLARLRDFKLVMDWGFLYRQVPCNCDKELGYHEHKIYGRTVYGWLVAPAEVDGEFTVMIPNESLTLVMQAASHGGARAGAGRPKGCVDFTPRKSRKKTPTVVASKAEINSSVGSYKNQELISSTEEPKGSSSEEKETVSLEVKTQSLNECLTPDSRLKLVQTEAGEGSMVHPHQPKAQASASVLGVHQPAIAPAAPPAVDDSAVLATILVDGKAMDSWTAIFAAGDAREISLVGGAKDRVRQRFTVSDFRATTELGSQIQHPKLPAPTKLTPAMTDDARIALLQTAYRAAYERVEGSQPFGSAKALTPKARAALLGASHALAAENISPTAWAKFSFWMWHRSDNARARRERPPSGRWVWDHMRIHELSGWCKEAVGSLANISTPLLPASKELLSRLARLQRELGWGRPTAVVVDEVLPDRERRVLLAKQAAQLDQWQEDIQRRIRSGEWVWG